MCETRWNHGTRWNYTFHGTSVNNGHSDSILRYSLTDTLSVHYNFFAYPNKVILITKESSMVKRTYYTKNPTVSSMKNNPILLT